MGICARQREEDGCENNIMIDRDARGEREELDPERVVSSSSDKLL